ncbi:hypothetical protein BKA67DRAFT_38522 [Truncatella angustata]|uniref:Uncharacterized protein n=1 Tax=Truncatella angustata TaxID=152316 RepID=A0A9P9A490_9PEZI|nr:uncharacterized protein BKA67DRAFT_38522 [Truncatella angustata]KAH6660050.1 hypothetical protein BKA67DRAFT_38522 [Truncatella angustata]
MADDALDESVRRCELELLTQQDGERLVSIARNERDFDWLCKIAIPIVQKKQECAAFVLGFIWNLYTSALQEVFPKEAALVIVRSTAESVARSFRVSQLVSMAYWLHESRKRATLHSKTGQSIVQILPSLPAPAKIATLTNFLTVMVELGMENELMILSDSLITQRQLMPEQELFNLYIPVLRDLFLMLEKLPGTSFTEPKYQKLFVGLIGEYWEKHKNARPQMHWGLKSRETKHGCRVCLTLDGFLLDKNKNKLTMSNHASTGNKAHLCKMLASLGDCLDYQDTGKQYHITKRTSDYQMDIKSWESCGSRIQSILRELNQYHLAKLLGRHYQSLVGVPPQACHADSSISIPQNLVTEQPGIPGYGSDVNQYAQHSTTQATQPTPSILNGPQNAPPVMFSAPRSMYRVSQRAETTCNASMVPCCPPDSGIRIPMTPNFQNQQPAANTKRKFDGQLTYPNKVNQATTNDHCMTNLEDVVDLTGED